tara:strand:+ start:841 stop:1827 length:987 start_codon:yes stop_codon:yes gene_type:complete
MINNQEKTWVEKYRPTKLSDISSQQNVIGALKNVAREKNIPHLIFFGPSGCGKTSTILALAKDIFKHEFENRTIELNASDERGISVIRNKIKKYAKFSVNSKNKSIPRWKLIILDEADSMTSESQCALRRIMEEYSHITRFCIICNYHNKIIDPIVSRCSLFRFKPIEKELILEKLEEICKLEKVVICKKDLKKIILISRGDMRKAINFLQKYQSINKNLTLDEIAGFINIDILKEWLDDCINCTTNDNIIIEKIDMFFNNGYSMVNQMTNIKNLVLQSKNLSDYLKGEIIIKLMEIDQNLIKGCDEYIQFLNLGYYIANNKNIKKLI